MTIKNNLSKEMLEYWYGELGSLQKVANHFKISVDSVYNYAKKYDLKYSKTFKAIYSCDENFFEKETPESFYLAGFIAADGSIQYRKYSKILKICLAIKDRDHLEKIKQLLKSTHRIKEYVVKSNNSSKCVELQIANSKLVNDLKKFNIVPNKTFVYQMPDWLLNHPLVNHFMRGYFDGDGSVGHSKPRGRNRTVVQLNWSILGTEKFINQYNEIFFKHLNLKFKPRKHYSVFRIGTAGNKICKKIKEFLYKDCSICLDRKLEKFTIPSRNSVYL